MQIDLTKETEELVQRHVSSGEFPSAEAVVEEAVRRFELNAPPTSEQRMGRRQGGQLKGQIHIEDDFDTLPDDIATAMGANPPSLDDLRNALQQGLDDFAAGRVIKCQNEGELREFFDDVKRRGRQRLLEQQAGE